MKNLLRWLRWPWKNKSAEKTVILDTRKSIKELREDITRCCENADQFNVLLDLNEAEMGPPELYCLSRLMGLEEVEMNLNDLRSPEMGIKSIIKMSKKNKLPTLVFVYLGIQTQAREWYILNLLEKYPEIKVFVFQSGKYLEHKQELTHKLRSFRSVYGIYVSSEEDYFVDIPGGKFSLIGADLEKVITESVMKI